MRHVLKRETFIALQARRQSYRIADSIRCPPLYPRAAHSVCKAEDALSREERQERIASRRAQEARYNLQLLYCLVVLLLAVMGGVLLLHFDGAF